MQKTHVGNKNLRQNMNQRPKNITIATCLLVFSFIIESIKLMFRWNEFYYEVIIVKGIPVYIMWAPGFICALFLWIVYKIYSGRNWARIVYLILAIISLLSFVISPKEFLEQFHRSIIDGLTSIMQPIISVTVVYLLFFGLGTNWFRSRTNKPQ